MIDSFTTYPKIYLQKLLKESQNVHIIQKIVSQIINNYQRQIENGDFKIKYKDYPLNVQKVKRGNQDNAQSRQSHSQQRYSMTLNKNIKQAKYFSQEQRQQFLKKIKKQQQQLRRVREQQIRLKQQKRKAQIQQKEKQEYEKKELKKKQIEKRLQQLAQLKLKRQDQIKRTNKQFQEISKNKILLHRLQDNYKRSQLQSLKQRNQQLNAIRQKHRPITKSDFEEHLMRIDQYLQKKQSRKDILKQQTVEEQSTKQIYKSCWYKQIIKEEQINQSAQQQEQKKQMIKKLKEKGKQYSQFIRVYRPPIIDQKLTQQLQQRQQKPIDRKKAQQIRQMGLKNLKYSKKHTISKEEIEKKTVNSNQEYPIKYKDYLQDFKINRRSNSLQQLFLQKTKEVLPKQKMQYLAERLQQKARQNQKLHRIRNQVLAQDVNEMYMLALNAKLNLLKN